MDADGNFYVSEQSGRRIRKISPAGDVTTLAGNNLAGSDDGIGSAASFNAPGMVAVGTDGNVYVADGGSNKIRKVTPTRTVTTLAGSGSAGSSDGTGSSATFNYPFGITVGSDGFIYVAELQGNKIRRITPTGIVTTLAGSGAADGSGTTATFNLPAGLAFDAQGSLAVVENAGNKIRRISRQ
ncbi:hypothetical protein ACIP1U_30740 [Cupriavidus sp. NPDC089707]|uniref:hypothetical protein n=1 Tax=Cupriavidus sp. NPDC089707 TaxID=3363963 RepID=UPI00380BCFDC